MKILEWIVWAGFLWGAFIYTLGIYLNVKRFNRKIQPGVYAWCFFLWAISLAFLFTGPSKFNMLWVAPAGFVMIYSVIFLIAFIGGVIRGIKLSGK